MRSPFAGRLDPNDREAIRRAVAREVVKDAGKRVQGSIIGIQSEAHRVVVENGRLRFIKIDNRGRDI